MTMKITRLTTYWSADEADTVVAFLDELRDTLWESYGDQITEMRRNTLTTRERDTRQAELLFDDDDIEF
jgi:hypothetical protein